MLYVKRSPHNSVVHVFRMWKEDWSSSTSEHTFVSSRYNVDAVIGVH